MQPITIEPLSYLGFILVIITFIYSFLKYKKENAKKAEPQPIQTIEENNYDERPVLVAAIAMMMEGKSFRIKRFIITGKQEKGSSWRQFGRQELMRRRLNMQK